VVSEREVCMHKCFLFLEHLKIRSATTSLIHANKKRELFIFFIIIKVDACMCIKTKKGGFF
jgi:hypothetical protein